jgi:hypothetical protein
MKIILLLFVCLTIGLYCRAQYVYTIKADSVKITDDCDSAELIIQNHTQNVAGFLYNTGNGRTIFKRALQKLNDSTYLIGTDTLKTAPPGSGINTVSGSIYLPYKGAVYGRDSTNTYWLPLVSTDASTVVYVGGALGITPGKTGQIFIRAGADLGSTIAQNSLRTAQMIGLDSTNHLGLYNSKVKIDSAGNGVFADTLTAKGGFILPGNAYFFGRTSTGGTVPLFQIQSSNNTHFLNPTVFDNVVGTRNNIFLFSQLAQSAMVNRRMIGMDSTNIIRIGGLNNATSMSLDSAGNVFLPSMAGAGSAAVASVGIDTINGRLVKRWVHGLPGIVSSNDLTGQTDAVTVASYTASADGEYSVGGRVTIIAVATNAVRLQAAWIDETNTARTQNFVVMGATTPDLSVTGAYPFPAMEIRAKAGTAIRIATVLVSGTGTVTYDVGGTIEQLR